MSLHISVHKIDKNFLKPSVPLHLVLTLLFVLQICGIVGLVGWLSFRNGERAVEDLATQLRLETAGFVIHHLEEYTKVPHQINRINLDAVELRLLDLSDLETTGHYFWRQMRVFDVGYINYANTRGDFISVERLDDDSLLINESSRQSPQTMSIYATDSKGNRNHLVRVLSDQSSVQEEAWFLDAVRAGKPIWSKIYQWKNNTGSLSISSSYPLYDQSHKLNGVIGVDLLLTRLSHFLDHIKATPSSRIFILEHDGLLVASSGGEQPFTTIQGRLHRLNALQSRDSLTRAAAQALIQQFGSLNQIHTSQQLSFQLNGTRQFVQVAPWQDEYGLNWLVVVALPESDLMAQINSNTHITIWLCLVALVLAAYLANLTSRWIAAPILRLSEASCAIATGELNHDINTSGIRELQILSQSFKQMAQQLKASFGELEQTNIQLEQRVELRTAELRSSEEKFAKAFWSSPIAIAISTLEEGRFLEVNDRIWQLLGYTREEVVGRNIVELNIWEYESDRSNFIQTLKQQGTAFNREVRLQAKSGKIVIVELSAELINIGEQDCILFVGNDITERKQAEAESHWLSALVENSTDFIAVATVDGQLTYLNPAGRKLIGLNSLVNVSQLTIADFYIPDDAVKLAKTPEQLLQGKPWQSEFELRHSQTKRTIPVLCSAFPIKNQETGEVVALGASIRDLSDRKQAEQKIQLSLKEKELLLKEVHHRVKNNLHLISNLFDLQSDIVTDQKILGLFTDAQTRIQTMALIHEQLYQSKDLRQIDFGEYIHRLAENICSCLGSRIGNVQLIIQAESIRLNLETAISCGLLINELITNSIKHAFPNTHSGEVHVELYQIQNQQLHLKVWDNGVGIPPEVAWQDTPSLGLKLVRILAKQLEATLTFDSTQGTRVHLIFTELTYNSRF
jgi:PAS domain S-box-containing protein